MDPLTLVRAYPIGYISMLDRWRNDEKIIAIPFSDPTYNTFQDLMDLPPHVFDEMAHFFTVYKPWRAGRPWPAMSTTGPPPSRSSRRLWTTITRCS